VLHGQGLGAQLLVDELQRAVGAVNAAGGRLIVVDALHERAAKFYSHHGFSALDTTPLRLVMKSSVAAASLKLLA
jgi:GNAT superfamily N-acetyltransferase